MIGSFINIAERVIQRGEWYLKSEELASATAEGVFLVRHYPFGEELINFWRVVAMSATYEGCLTQFVERRLDVMWQVCRSNDGLPDGLNEKQTTALAMWTEELARANQAPAVDLTVEGEMHVANDIPLWQISWIPGSEVALFLGQYLKTEREQTDRRSCEEVLRIQCSVKSRVLGNGL